MSKYSIVMESNQETVVSEYATVPYKAERYQSEAELESMLVERLVEQGYEKLDVREESGLLGNLRTQLENLNEVQFSDGEWERFLTEVVANKAEGIVEKTRKIQDDPVQLLKRDDGSTKNITLVDKKNAHNNRLQVIRQYVEVGGNKPTRYDVTILVNGLPLIHIELKRRGVAIREAFNQIRRYQKDSFWAGAGLYEYIQVFVISNGTNTRYYSNTTRERHIESNTGSGHKRSVKTSNSYEFTNTWADGNNQVIQDLGDFARTFFARHTVLNLLTRYCVFDVKNDLLVMRPYQIAATERVIGRIDMGHNYKSLGTRQAGGYVWHTTGSGKTLTSFKTAQLASKLAMVDKVVFVVDRKDLDYQTMREYDRFQKGAANSNTSTRILQGQLESKEAKIIITTIQKLGRFIDRNKSHAVYQKNVVLIFDECHRSQFGEMHRAIVKNFKKYWIFGFTGTPIFAVNSPGGKNNPTASTTEQVFGDKLHTYTIVDAIRDGNVLPFRIDYVNTFRMADAVEDKKITAIDEERALSSPERIQEVVGYVLEHFDQKTKRNSVYSVENKRLAGFNAIMAVGSIEMAKKYYGEFKRQLNDSGKELRFATIYSFGVNEEDPELFFDEEEFETEDLDQSSRDFLDAAIRDYNRFFNVNFDTSADKFQNYYKDLSMRVKEREVDLLIVVNMFLTGFDATTLNTLWVDKKLRQHGLIQAFSRTNRILNSVKTFGNIVCFRDLRKETDEAIGLFGDKEAGGIVLLRTYEEYYYGFEQNGKHTPGYEELIAELEQTVPYGGTITGETAERNFVKLFGKVLKTRNILNAFDEFEGNEILSDGVYQNYQSLYIDLYQKETNKGGPEREDITGELVFEMELIRQVEVNIDYILMLVAKYHEGNQMDKSILEAIDSSIGSSLELRSKKELIHRFIGQMNILTQVDEDWRVFVEEQKKEDLEEIISQEDLKKEATHRFMEGALKDGNLKTTGTDIDQLLPAISRFGGGREEKKRDVIGKLMLYFEKYLGLGG